jgi:hypothetical protein
MQCLAEIASTTVLEKSKTSWVVPVKTSYVPTKLYWHSALKSAKRLVGLLVRSAPLIVGSSSVSWVKAITKKDEATLLRLLEAMELLEEQVALVPTEVTLVRDEQEIVRPPADKFPKRVRSWNRLIRKFRRAYQDSSHK